MEHLCPSPLSRMTQPLCPLFWVPNPTDMEMGLGALAGWEHGKQRGETQDEPQVSLPVPILFASRWDRGRPGTHLLSALRTCSSSALWIPHNHSFAPGTFWVITPEPDREKCQMAKRQLSSKTTSMICVLNFRFIYTSIWVHFHELPQLPDTKPLKKKPPGAWDESRWSVQARTASICPIQLFPMMQKVIKNALKNLVWYWSTAGLWGMSNFESIRTQDEPNDFFFLMDY